MSVILKWFCLSNESVQLSLTAGNWLKSKSTGFVSRVQVQLSTNEDLNDPSLEQKELLRNTLFFKKIFILYIWMCLSWEFNLESLKEGNMGIVSFHALNMWYQGACGLKNSAFLNISQDAATQWTLVNMRTIWGSIIQLLLKGISLPSYTSPFFRYRACHS